MSSLFKKISYAVGFMLFINATIVSAESTDGARNIIFVLVDDLRFDGMGFLQDELETPNIDELAESGVYFPNAVVTSSLCSPSRATILTGMTARNHKIVDNNNSSEEGLVFFPKYLQGAGYQTGFFGKWHMGEHSDMPREGFDKWVSFPGQGAYYPSDYIPPHLQEQGVVNQLNVDGQHVDQKGYITDELTGYALNWLESGIDKSKPFFLYLSHKAVHSDPLPAERHKGQYDNVNFKLPDSAEVTEEDAKNKPMWVHNQRNSWHGNDFIFATDLTMKEYIKHYYETLSAVDESLGELMNYLRKNDLIDNTMVVFYSDNGFLIGDHGLIDKRNAYEGSVRVPLVISAPGLLPKGEIKNTVVRNLDLAPTFLDLAGVASPVQFEGKSFLPVASGKVNEENWDTPDFVYEYYWEWSFPSTPTTFAIRRDNLKYIQYHGVWDIEELYDLDSDPNEMRNLIRDPKYASQLLPLRKALYNALRPADGSKPSVPFNAKLAEGMNLRNKDGLKAAPFPEWWLVEPNRTDVYMGVFPDTPLKLEKQRKGEFYFPYMENTDKAVKH
ncbi:sulfatase [Aestuariibacter sp. GS-14]|uniref:sulfatase family protein n=1 Tax=Aestuariibacter sp. GS-14 TaxID=2590670 RepID=UPI00112CB747|nr:sulfatase [Aestuariibacter sp. GS-14]TPV61788.1 sulfatase [Aestuariibacter sp. GS-14]